MDYETILWHKENGVGTITLNRPDKLNTYTDQVGQELTEVLKGVEGDGEVKVVVITGAGRAFCAGADVHAFERGIEARRRGERRPSIEMSLISRGPQLFRNLGKPIIASINGPAVGIGFTLAVACDLRIASEEATLGAVFVRVGLVPEFGSTYNLPRIVGLGKALELLFTGKVISAREAEAIGLVNKVVPAAKLAEATKEFAASLAEGPPISMQFIKRGLYQSLDADLATQLQYEAFTLNHCFQTEDHAEGVRAFLEKRKPRFQGK